MIDLLPDRLLRRLGFIVEYVSDFGVHSSRYDFIDYAMSRPVHPHMSVAPMWAKRRITKAKDVESGASLAGKTDMTDSLPNSGHGSVYDRVLTFLHDRDSAIAGDPPCATEIDESVLAILQITRPAPIEPGVREKVAALVAEAIRQAEEYGVGRPDNVAADAIIALLSSNTGEG